MLHRVSSHLARSAQNAGRISSFGKRQLLRSTFASLPEHQLVGLPALSPTMEFGTIGSWNVKEGDRFGAGKVLAEIETDKATMGFEAQDPGVVAKILVQPGSEVKVGTPIMIVVDSADETTTLVAAFADYVVSASSAPTPAGVPAPTPAGVPAPPQSAPTHSVASPATDSPHPAADSSGSTSDSRVFASPLARKLAREKGIDVSQIKATGPRNRVVAADVEAWKPAPSIPVDTLKPAATAVEPTSGSGFLDFPVSESRREIALRMTKSKQEVPHYYLTVDIEMDALISARSNLNKVLPQTEQLTVNDMLLKAAALAMKTVPDVNASWMETRVRMFSRCDINFIVGTGESMSSPVIIDAGSKGLKTIADEVRLAVEGSKSGTLSSEAFSCGTFTVVNLGMYGIKSAAPIVTMPQAAVLGLGSIEQRVLPNDDKESDQIYRLADVLTATCSFDHRVVDGAVGAQWLAAFKKLVENPITMLL